MERNAESRLWTGGGGGGGASITEKVIYAVNIINFELICRGGTQKAVYTEL